MNDMTVTEGLFLLMGKKGNEVVSELGQPDRKDPTPYGYDWWIYNEEKENYVQVGVKDNRVVTIFTIGENVNISPFYIGEPIGDIYSSYFIESLIKLHHEDESYWFELSEEDINIRPIIRMGNYYVQLYIDQYLGTVSSVRLMDASTLAAVRPFNYQGEEKDAHINQLLNDEELVIGYQKQLFDLTNILRSRFNKKPLQWDEKAAEEAYKSSMELYRYAKDNSESNQAPIESLKLSQMMYVQEGENIAVHNVDAPATIEEWLNNKVNRDNLLNSQFTGVGIGIYRNYLIQKFTSLNTDEK
jgi:uncharacterized protein YkwD